MIIESKISDNSLNQIFIGSIYDIKSINSCDLGFYEGIFVAKL